MPRLHVLSNPTIYFRVLRGAKRCAVASGARLVSASLAAAVERVQRASAGGHRHGQLSLGRALFNMGPQIARLARLCLH